MGGACCSSRECDKEKKAIGMKTRYLEDIINK